MWVVKVSNKSALISQGAQHFVASFAAVIRVVTQRWEKRCVTTLITAAKETKHFEEPGFLNVQFMGDWVLRPLRNQSAF